jgi:S-adenosylmethionine:tRNA ribosyltransferase-isomerase
MYSLAQFDYHLPRDLIAQYPLTRCEESRLLILNRKDMSITHGIFSDVLNFLDEGDVLVVNDSKVIPARLLGRKETGGKVELLLLHYPLISQGNGNLPPVECLIRSSRKPQPGARLHFDNVLVGEVIKYVDYGKAVVRFDFEGDFEDILNKVGQLPLPPYIKRRPQEEIDGQGYQTIFAHKKGSVAAPTAGLHFSEGLLEKIGESGVSLVPVTLHVGYGTFIPVRTEDIRRHKMHEEAFEVTREGADTINHAKKMGGRIVAVGTTTTRLLEYMGSRWGEVKPCSGLCDLFIYPGYHFKLIDRLITNFHLPKSTLIMMVSAFAGRDLIMKAYQEAIHCGYRFYSYGDAIFIM